MVACSGGPAVVAPRWWSHGGDPAVVTPAVVASRGDTQVLVPALCGMYLLPFTKGGVDSDSVHLTKAFPLKISLSLTVLLSPHLTVVELSPEVVW